MPIYSAETGKRISAIHENEVFAESDEVLNEGLFKGNPPEEFHKLAMTLYEKLSKKLPIKKMHKQDPKDYIKKNKKWRYDYAIENDDYNPLAGFALAGAKGAAVRAISGPMVAGAVNTVNTTANVRSAHQAELELDKVIKGTHLFKEVRANGSNDYIKVSNNGKYLFRAWAAVSKEGKYYTAYSIILACKEIKAKDHKLYKLDEAAATSELPGFADSVDADGNVNLASLFAGFSDSDDTRMDLLIPSEELRKYQPYPELKKAFNEHFDIHDQYTRRSLMAMNEAQHNAALTALTSKLYDQIVSKAHNIDFGEIPKTKGDITKLSNFETMKETLAIIKGIVTEYKQDTKPIDEVSVAIGNIQGRKDMFERAFRANCEMPMLMYDNMVMAVVVGTSYLITACIEFIKAPKDETFTIQLDKVAYNKSKDHLIYNSISKFNHICENGDFDQAMNMIIDKKIRKFTGITIGAGIVVGVIILTNIIPLLRELVYLFYHTKVSISDYCDTQADLLTMNAYNLQCNDINTDPDTKSEIVKKQNKIAEKFRKVANFFAIKNKKAEVAATKDIENSTKKYKLDADANVVTDEPDEGNSGSALF